jgi:membrane protein YqaA with SNARE-associated domain
MSLLVLWLTTFAVCVAGAIIPFINTEIYLVSGVALNPESAIPYLVVAATIGQMVGKVAMYYAGRGVLKVPNERVKQGVAKVRERLERRPRTAGLVLFSSSLVGIPPLYVVSIACGTIGMRLIPFFLIGTLGRLIHFGAVAMIPEVARSLIG